MMAAPIVHEVEGDGNGLDVCIAPSHRELVVVDTPPRRAESTETVHCDEETLQAKSPSRDARGHIIADKSRTESPVVFRGSTKSEMLAMGYTPTIHGWEIKPEYSDNGQTSEHDCYKTLWVAWGMPP
jgi:hypothetical protein